ncbi:MAG: hypothetical protein AAFX06_01655 [Planctomycetota bacterium]
MIRSSAVLILVVAMFAVFVSGCSSSTPTSVTTDTSQSEIDAWKAKEAKINAEAEENMELDG